MHRPAGSRPCTRGAVQLMLAVAMVCGCRVGPDFMRPSPPSVTSRFAEASAPEDQSFDELTYWWTYLHDPVLESLIAEACSQNLDLQESYYRISVARARLGAVRADRLPQTDATSKYAYRDFAENASPFISATAGNRSFSFHSLGFDTTWELDLFGKIARSIESAAADVFAEVEEYRDVKVTLLAEVASTYIEVRLAQARSEIARRNLATQQETQRIVRQRFGSGLVSPLDEAQAESNAYRTAATLPELLQREQTAVNQLAVLLGRTPDDTFRQRLAAGSLPICPPEVAVGVPADLLTRRPDVRRAERQVASATALIGVAVAAKYPQVTLLGTISVEAKDIDMLFSGGSLANSVGPSMRWNILNFRQLDNIIAGRKAEMRVAVINYRNTVLEAVQEVEDGLVSYHRQAERAAVLDQAVAATRRAAASSQERYERGLIGFQPVLDSQRELLSVEDELAVSRAETLLGLVRVYKALGGGWQADCSQEVTAQAQVSNAADGEDAEVARVEPSIRRG